MKRTLLFLTLFISLQANAQILNGGFEIPGIQNAPANWGKILSIQFPCTNSAGFDSMYFQNNDAHSGNHALEIRNAFCDANFYSGGAHLAEVDGFYSNSGVPYSTSPVGIDLFYKFFPIEEDVVNAHIELWDTDGFLLAEGDTTFTQTIASYTKCAIYLNYQPVIATPALLTISFNISNPSTHVHYGTRFLVDDIGEHIVSTGVNDQVSQKKELAIFPNPAHGFITMRSKENKTATLILTDVTGRKVLEQNVQSNEPISIQHLQAGYYSYQCVQSDKKITTGKLIVE